MKISQRLSYILVLLPFASSLNIKPTDPVVVRSHPSKEGYLAQISRGDGEFHHLNLQKSQKSILGNDIHVLNVDVDSEGNPIFEKWVPTDEDLTQANEVFIDEANKGVFRISTDSETSKITLNGIYSDSVISHNGITHLFDSIESPENDYIDLERNISSNTGMPHVTQSVNAVVELVFVCDKEFGDLFGQNNQRILDYFTVYMWDVNMRYKTLPSDNISFRLNGIVLISTFAAQPFIEEVRDENGVADIRNILPAFSYWVYSQRNNMPKHDLAALITNTTLEWRGGLAYLRAACWVDEGAGRDIGSAVWNDAGWWGSTSVATHELGHNLGAPHDDDADFPEGCTQIEQGFIMISTGGNKEYRYLFSSCSDRLISQFVRSEAASCLTRIDETNNPVIDPSFSNPKAPTMDEVCKRFINSDQAFVPEADSANCTVIRCWNPQPNGGHLIYSLPQLENVICAEEGRCFRGVCRKPSHVFKNVGSNLCMVASNPFEFTAPALMISCPIDATPLERFLMTSTPSGVTLGTPYTSDLNEEIGDKCLYTGNVVGGNVTTDRCNPANSGQIWELTDVGSGRYLLVHKLTGRCAKPQSRSVGSLVQSLGNCDRNNADMLWTINF